MKTKLALALAALLLSVPLTQAAAAPDGWELLKSLAGDWEGKSPEGVAHISYKVVSNGHAVMESIMEPNQNGPGMITIYHRDGDNLMATHYCSAGNQPRMRAGLTPPEGKRLEFRFVDITNLKTPEAGHIHDLTMTFVDKDHLRHEWVYREKGKDSKAVFELTRQPAK